MEVGYYNKQINEIILLILVFYPTGHIYAKQSVEKLHIQRHTSKHVIIMFS